MIEKDYNSSLYLFKERIHVEIVQHDFYSGMKSIQFSGHYPEIKFDTLQEIMEWAIGQGKHNCSRVEAARRLRNGEEICVSWSYRTIFWNAEKKKIMCDHKDGVNKIGPIPFTRALSWVRGTFPRHRKIKSNRLD